jgi:hypothetical protein
MQDEGMSLRQSAAWGAVAFGVALAVIIGVRLEQAALAVVVGVACGVGASIPASLVIISLLRRRAAREEQRRAQRVEHQAAPAPPVVVIAPPQTAQLPQPANWPGAYGSAVPSPRHFEVIGEEETDYELDDWQAQT